MKGYDSWKLSTPPEYDDLEPSDEHIERAIRYFVDLEVNPSREEIMDKAYSLMVEDIDESKRDAAEYAADSRDDYDSGRGNF